MVSPKKMLVACIVAILSVISKEAGCTSCDAPLGMEDGRIHDGQLLSKGGADGFDAKDSRIGNGKGWCSDQEDVTNSTYRDSIYLQVDLFDVHKITKLNITGGKGYKEYVPGTFAKLSYRVDQNSEYIDYKTPLHIFGIKFPSTRALKLEPPIVARYLKYQPQIDANSKCVTMEIYGCPLPNSSCKNAILSGSMDYTATASEVPLSPRYIAAGISSLPWGPGKSSSSAFGDYVTIKLKNTYLITGVQTYEPKYAREIKEQPDSFMLSYRYENHTWNAYTGRSKEAIKFNTSKTLGNMVRINPTIAAEYMRIFPEQSVGKYLKMQFYGCSLSDPTIFDVKTPPPVTSDQATSPRLTTTTTEASTVKSKTTDLFSTTPFSNTESTSVIKVKTKKIEDKDKNIKERKSTTHKPPLNVTREKYKSNLTLIIVIIVLVVVLVAVIVLFLVFLYRKRWRSSWRNMRYARNNQRSNSNGKQSSSEDNHLMTNLSKNPIYEVSFKNESDETYHLYAEVPGDLGETNDNLQSEIKEERRTAIEHMEEPDDYYSELAENNKGYAQVTVDTNSHDVAPVYAEPDTETAEDIELNPIYGLSSGDDDSQIYEKAKSLYERAKIYEDPYQNVTGSSLYADPDMVKERASFEVREFPRDRLRFLEKIGTGQFGEVHICEVESLGSIIGSDAGQCSWIMSSTIKVAVKMLKSDVEKNIEKEFMKEVRVMARLQHENVVQLLGVCEEEPKCMVVEYMENGDLNQFLKSYSLTDGLSDTSTKVLNEQTLLYMCMQICGGMKYLASQGFVHRDLATRNCLIGHSFTVKISDFGMSRYLYSKHYYRIEGRAVLPIRWMAPESLFYGTFTSQSDVWAFGVTLWEVLTFARETPYEMMTDQQVIENACSIVAKEQQSFRCLPRPPICSDLLYRLLLNCWKKSPAERPNFSELAQFFKRLVNSVEASI